MKDFYWKKFRKIAKKNPIIRILRGIAVFTHSCMIENKRISITILRFAAFPQFLNQSESRLNFLNPDLVTPKKSIGHSWPLFLGVSFLPFLGNFGDY